VGATLPGKQKHAAAGAFSGVPTGSRRELPDVPARRSAPSQVRLISQRCTKVLRIQDTQD
jgi:hypothetical protein